MGFKVNFSDEEAASQARDYTPMPTGKYYVRVTDIEDKICGPEAKNAGKPYWAVEFTIQDGQYEDRKAWTNAMIFEGALYTLSQLLKSTGFEHALETGDIPDGEELVSKECIISLVKVRDKYREKEQGSAEALYKNEVKGIAPYEGVSPTSASTTSVAAGSGSLLP
jgi:hypothetical protein